MNKAKNDGWTPLCSTIEKGHLEIVKVLIAGGADVNETVEDGTTPLYIVSMNDDTRS